MLRSTLKLLVLLASFSFLAACGGGDDGPDCTDTMATSRGALVIGANCTGCHSATSANRNGAPPAVNFDNGADIDTHEARIRDRAINLKTMPPAAPTGPGPLPAGQASDLEAYLDCR